MLKGFSRNLRPLEILSNEQVEAIHRGTLDVLEHTGVTVEHKRALELFADHGCTVNFQEKRVRIPGYVVEECLRKCPSSFTLKARDPENDLRIGGSTLYFAESVGSRIVDLNSWEPRQATLQEHSDTTRVLDALPNVHYLWTYESFQDMAGVPPVMAPLEALASGLRNSGKTQGIGHGQDIEVFGIQMAKAVGTDLLGNMSTSQPLAYSKEACEAAFRYAEAGFPFYIGSGGMYGATCPVTIAGATITNNVEAIAKIVLVQLIRSGTGVLVADFTFPMNMVSGNPIFAALEAALHSAAFNQIWRGKYGIPTCVDVPGYSNSKKADFQCGYEKALAALAAALSGASVIGLQGCIHGELTLHAVQAILDDDIAGWIGRFIGGIEVNDETLAIELIEEVGPVPGYYLDKEHTRKWWKKESFEPKVADRLTYPEWMAGGKRSALDYAKERMGEILATHEPNPLTSTQEEEVERILREAKRYYREKGLVSSSVPGC